VVRAACALIGARLVFACRGRDVGDDDTVAEQTRDYDADAAHAGTAGGDDNALVDAASGDATASLGGGGGVGGAWLALMIAHARALKLLPPHRANDSPMRATWRYMAPPTSSSSSSSSSSSACILVAVAVGAVTLVAALQPSAYQATVDTTGLASTALSSDALTTASAIDTFPAALAARHVRAFATAATTGASIAGCVCVTKTPEHKFAT
jgi:hypothetical protein